MYIGIILTICKEKNMLKIPELKFGFNDAVNYKFVENKKFFNNIFLRTDSLDKLCESNVYFLMGEKGTGKTAYAIYLVNNSYRNNLSSIKYIRETDYEKFLILKKERHLTLSDYTSIWKVILYLLLSEQISRKVKKLNWYKYSKLHNLKKAIDDYYVNAFSPEIISAINFIEESKLSAELIAKYAKIGGEKTSGISFTEKRFQSNLLFIEKNFMDALNSLKLKNNHVLFLDGIDIRPENVPYDDYLENIKGLANAVWSINTDFFSSIRDSPGRMRVVLLIRPDIFDTLGLQNQNNKIRDNSVLLDWRTTYPTYRKSNIFNMVDTLLSAQQDKELKTGEAWDYYFPYDSPNVIYKDNFPSSFINFLRHSYYRPRDIITMLDILRENFIEQGSNINRVFSEEDFDEPNFKRKLAEYLLGEVKDHLSFYHSSADYELFLKFFEFLNGSYKFSYIQYQFAFFNFEKYLAENLKNRPVFFETADIFLQFLYELNVLCYVEETRNEPLIRWCFRERNLSKISPKVKIDSRYEIHYGIQKALNLGKRIY